jgi:adenine-specific DNA-methyltransferase
MKNKTPQKINLTSSDLSTEKLAELHRILPEAFAEDKINWDKLRAVLGDAIDNRIEKFNFTWAGKSNAIKNVLVPSKLTLKPAKGESIKWDNSENLFIEGDNLEVLKLLQKTYFEKVKMIYIDPPYNTGSDFVYNDDFKLTNLAHAQLSGEVATNGDWLVANPASKGKYHSDWLSMMYPRLKLAWNLLREDGVIFISIDDHEVNHLRLMMDEIFGEENFIGCAARVAKKSNNKGDFWAPNFDYILTYTKNRPKAQPFFGGVNYEAYDQVETDGPRKGEKYQLVRLYMSTIENRNPDQRFYIDCPDGSKIIPPGSTFPPERPVLGDGIWRWTKKKFEEERDRIVIKKVKSSNLIDENGQPAKWNVFTKTYLNDVIRDASAKPNSLVEDFINQLGSHELTKLNIPFDYPKPSELIKYLIEISKTDSDSIVLDFFAGSGSTGHAVLKKNQEDGQNRKFILVQLPELTDINSEAYKAGYKTIADIAKERIRRVIKGYGDNPEPIDAGFKVFKLDQSNYVENNFEFDPTKSEAEQAEAFKAYLAKAKQQGLFDESNDLDVVFENIVKEGLSLNSKIDEVKIGKDNVYRVFDDTRELLICLKQKISKETVSELTAKENKDKVFICLDSALDDSTKANLALNLELKTI